MHENMTFVIRKLNIVLGAFPPLDPRSPLDLEMSIHIYSIFVKGIFGLEGGTWLYKQKIPSNN